MSEKRRNYPLPNYVTLVEIPSSEEGEEQQLGLVFDPNFPGFEYHKDEEAAYDAYCDRVDQFLRAEYPQLGPVLDQAPFLADAYALHLLVEVAVMQTFTEIQHESLEQGDWQAAAELGATNLLSVNALVERLDFESFLRTHVAENAAQYHHLFNAFPESYFVAGQLIDKIKIVEEGTEVYLDDAQKADMKKKAEESVIRRHQSEIVDQVLEQLKQFSFDELLQLVLDGGREALKKITDRTAAGKDEK